MACKNDFKNFSNKAENGKMQVPFQPIKEMYDRYFWHTLFSYNFSIYKKAYLQTLICLCIPPNIYMTPVHTKK